MDGQEHTPLDIFATSVGENLEGLVRAVRGLTGLSYHDAEEAVSEAMLRVVERAPEKQDAILNPKSLLLHVARKKGSNIWRGAGRRRAREGEVAKDEVSMEDDPASRDWLEVALYIAAHGQDYKTTRFRYWLLAERFGFDVWNGGLDGSTFAQIAPQLDCSSATLTRRKTAFFEELKSAGVEESFLVEEPSQR